MFSIQEPSNYTVESLNNSLYKLSFPVNVSEAPTGYLYDVATVVVSSNDIDADVAANLSIYQAAATESYNTSQAKHQINIYKSQLAASDYQILKTVEKYIVGAPLPYDAATLLYDREALRGRINQIESLPDATTVLELEKQHKLLALSAACRAAITNGITVNELQYSLNTFDQINISSLALQAQGGSPVPYHANGELCRLYEPAEFLAIVQASIQHITYHTTYYNCLKNYVNSVTSVEALSDIAYGCSLPDEYASTLIAITCAGGASDVEVSS